MTEAMPWAVAEMWSKLVPWQDCTGTLVGGLEREEVIAWPAGMEWQQAEVGLVAAGVHVSGSSVAQDLPICLQGRR